MTVKKNMTFILMAIKILLATLPVTTAKKQQLAAMQLTKLALAHAITVVGANTPNLPCVVHYRPTFEDAPWLFSHVQVPVNICSQNANRMRCPNEE